MRRSQRPGVLAVRSLNQYRQRDVLTYLGLRYYLDNESSRTDQWAKVVAPDLVCRRGTPSYFKSLHYKQEVDGSLLHREMHFPTANEALAEAALISACSESLGDGFSIPDQVFSYRPTRGSDCSGIFEHYMIGLQRRHDVISSLCRRDGDSTVQFIDIKKFYPSVSCALALGAWKRACSNSDLPSSMVLLGERLISDHGEQTSSAGGHILTGPMFSHLLANLVMRSVDDAMGEADVGYLRYVDDITLVGTKAQVSRAADKVRGILDSMGLTVHDESSEKTINITAAQWLDGEDDFKRDPNEDSWMSLVGDIKAFLVAKPVASNDLSLRFSRSGFRLPVMDYSAVAQGAGYIDKFEKFLKFNRMASLSEDAAIDELSERAHFLQRKYYSEIVELIEKHHSVSGYEEKRIVPKIRYRMGRLAYLSPRDELSKVSRAVDSPALALQREVINAIASNNLDKILSMGGNAAQAVAQPLSVEGKGVEIRRGGLSATEMESVAILKLNGITVNAAESFDRNELVEFADVGATRALMKSEDPYISTISCLHGLTESPRHPETLETPFDSAEQISHDAIDLIANSMSN